MSPIRIHHGRPIAWRPPSGWEDLPPPPDVALVFARDGRVLGRCRPVAVPPGAAWVDLALKRSSVTLRLDAGDVAVPLAEVRRLILGSVSALAHLDGPDRLRGGGAARAHRWQALVVPQAELHGPTPAELPLLLKGFQRE